MADIPLQIKKEGSGLPLRFCEKDAERIKERESFGLPFLLVSWCKRGFYFTSMLKMMYNWFYIKEPCDTLGRYGEDSKNKILMEVILLNKQVLTAPCGLDCFNCPTYEGNITEEWKNQVSEFLKIPIEKTPCKGCRDEKGYCKFAPNQQCATWNCVQEKGVSFCHECTDFPCEMLMPTQQGASFPHNMKVYNLCRMKLIGLDNWIEESVTIRKRYFDGKFLVGQGPILEE